MVEMVQGIPGLGHNSDGADDSTESVAARELQQFIERVERLEEEKKAIQGDIKDVFGEAKGRGYDIKTIKDLIRERRQDENERIERETLLETYRAALQTLKEKNIPVPKGKK